MTSRPWSSAASPQQCESVRSYLSLEISRVVYAEYVYTPITAGHRVTVATVETVLAAPIAEAVLDVDDSPAAITWSAGPENLVPCVFELGLASNTPVATYELEVSLAGVLNDISPFHSPAVC